MGGVAAGQGVIWPDGTVGSFQPPSYRETSQGLRATSEYGWRTHPVTGQRDTFHAGLDLIGWSIILAPFDGVVSFAGYNGGAGNEVRIKADNGDTFRLLHNRELWVRTGDRVSKGQGVAVMGTTGSSTGVHCHFETRPGGGATINPRDYMAAHGEEEPMTYEQFLAYLQRAFTFDLRPRGTGTPGQTWEAGPTIFEQFDGVNRNVNGVKADVATVNANVLKITGGDIDYAALARELNAEGVTVVLIEPEKG